MGDDTTSIDAETANGLLDAFVATGLGATAMRCFLLVLDSWPHNYRPNCAALGRRMGISGESVRQTFRQLADRGLLFEDGGFMPITDPSGWSRSGRAGKLRDHAIARRSCDSDSGRSQDRFAENPIDRKTVLRSESHRSQDGLANGDPIDHKTILRSPNSGSQDGLAIDGGNHKTVLGSSRAPAELKPGALNTAQLASSEKGGPGGNRARYALPADEIDHPDDEVEELAVFVAGLFPELDGAAEMARMNACRFADLGLLRLAAERVAYGPRAKRPHTNIVPLIRIAEDWQARGGPSTRERETIDRLRAEAALRAAPAEADDDPDDEKFLEAQMERARRLNASKMRHL